MYFMSGTVGGIGVIVVANKPFLGVLSGFYFPRYGDGERFLGCNIQQLSAVYRRPFGARPIQFVEVHNCFCRVSDLTPATTAFLLSLLVDSGTKWPYLRWTLLAVLISV